MNILTDSTNKRELTLTRTFDAPREFVWKAWTDSHILQQWWGPFGVTNPTCEIDAKVGGAITIVMLAGEALGSLKGSKWPMKGVIKELQEPSLLVFVSSAIEDEDGTVNLEQTVSVTLNEVQNKTEMIVAIQVTKATPKTEQALAGMEMGWNQQLDKLKSLLNDQAK